MQEITGTDHQGQFHVWSRDGGRGTLQRVPGTCFRISDCKGNGK